MDEEDSCRICRSGPEPSSPLYHPCKCTGSIRFCHQDCLVEWLQHSRKKYCELCNHAFLFDKKYRKDMPSDGQMPRYLYLRRLVVRTASVSVMAARAVLVAMTWLGVLPYVNIHVWRFLFWSADVATWMLIPGSEPPFGILSPSRISTPTNSTANSTAAVSTSIRSRPTPLLRLSGKSLLEGVKTFVAQLAHDCFQGQILSCVIIVFFVGIFLLREWILQNVPQHFDPPPPVAAEPEPIQPPAPPAPQTRFPNPEVPFEQWPQLQQSQSQQEQESAMQQSAQNSTSDLAALPFTPHMDDLRQARLRRFQDTTQVDNVQDQALAFDDWASSSYADTAWPNPQNDELVQEAERREQFLTDMGWASKRDDPLLSHHADQIEPRQHASASSAWREEWEEPETGQQQEARLQRYGEHFATPPPPAPASESEPIPSDQTPENGETVVQPIAEDDDSWQDETDDDQEPIQPVQMHEAGHAARPVVANGAVAAAAGHIHAADAELDANDPDMEAGFAEEMDGILQAVGMRGPLFGIVQNLCLMIFLCTFVMLTCLTMPYIAGKLLGSGRRLLQLIALPIKLLRLVTDPVFDFLIGVGTHSVVPKVASTVGWKTAAPSSLPARAQPGQLASFFAPILSFGSTSAKVQETSSTTFLDKTVLSTIRSSAQWKAIGSTFEIALTTGVRGTIHNVGHWIMNLVARLDAHTAGTSTMDRVICVAFGHGYWLLILFVHQHFSKPDLSAAIASQSALKLFMDQHVLIIKAVSFIFIELALFPLGCGLLLDLCVMPLFPNASIWNWPDMIRFAPISFAFVRWMGGSIYMFVFAQYVSATRKVLRPGVLCWIRDPNDPNFHPIKDILDKRSVTQLRKIGASAVMYAGILVASLGVNVYFLRYALGFTGVLPLRWKPLSTLTEVPLDLLAVHMVIPWAMRLVDPEELSEWALKLWWKSTSRMLRLSSYMMGGEFADERKTAQPTGAPSWVVRLLQIGAPETKAAINGTGSDGGLHRVPADDKAITTGPLIIPVKQDGSPLDEKAADAVLKQEEQMEKQTVKATYTNLYLPPDHHRRITLILALLWLTHCALLIVGLSAPLLLGRGLASFVQQKFAGQDPHDIHDFYAFLVGISLFAMGFKLSMLGRKLWSRACSRSRRLGTSPYGFFVVGLARKLGRFVQAGVLVVGVAGLTPLVVGLVVEQYVIVPLRYDTSIVPRVQLWQTWALGLLELRLAVYMIRFFGVPSTGPIKWFVDGADQVVRRGVVRPRVRVAYTRIVLPIVVLGSAMLILPIITADILATKRLVTPPMSREEEQILLRKVYGAVQSALMILAAHTAIAKRMESWTDLLKDEIFLESTELKNYETASLPASTSPHEQYHAEGTLPDVLFR